MNKDKVYLKGYVVGHAADTLGYHGLMVQLENLDIVEIDKNLVHREIDELQPIKLKDVIARIKGFDLGTQKVWLNEILNELGSDYGTLKYKAGYEQGKFEGEWVGQQLKDADKIRQELNKPAVPQFVAEKIEYFKKTGDWDLFQAMDYSFGEKDIREWLEVKNNQETFARAWLDGYEVEKEKRYRVKLKSNPEEVDYLVDTKRNGLRFYSNIYTQSRKHTRKEIEDAGFGWVFDCPGIEIEEEE